MKNKHMLFLALAALSCFLAGCKTATNTQEEAAQIAIFGGVQKPLLETETGEVISNPYFVSNVDSVGSTISSFGFPYAELATNLYGLAATGVALLVNASRKREKSMVGTLVKSVEKTKDSRVKRIVSETSTLSGNAVELSKRVESLT